MRNRDIVKYQVLLIQQSAIFSERSVRTIQNLFNQNKKFMTQTKFAFKFGKLTRSGHCKVSWFDQLNDVSVIMELTDEELNCIQGMFGLLEYQKRAILIYAYDIAHKIK